MADTLAIIEKMVYECFDACKRVDFETYKSMHHCSDAITKLSNGRGF